MNIISIEQGIKILQNKDILAFPTETVYGIGANAYEKEAYEKIYKIKNRPKHNPLIIHCYNLSQAQTIGIFNDTALKLAQKFWPGPLTLLLPKKSDIQIINKNNTVCIRIPSHPIAQNLLQQLPFPLAAPSANMSNYISSTTAQHVYNDFQDKLPIIEGEIIHGIESTIIDCLNSDIKILRNGSITFEDIKKITNKIKYNNNDNTRYTNKKSIENNYKTLQKNSNQESHQKINNDKKNQILSPGQLHKHYSPTTPLHINYDIQKIKKKIKINTSLNTNTLIIYIYHGKNIDLSKHEKSQIKTINLSPTSNLKEIAKNLYTKMREADQYALLHNIQNIYIQKIDNIGIGIAINEKLSRASCK